MKRPATAAPLNPDNPHSAVYVAARREWNERYGDYIAHANNWRLIAIAALGVAALAVAGNVWQSAQSRVQPFVVEVDRLGDALAVAQCADVALARPGERHPRPARALHRRTCAPSRSTCRRSGPSSPKPTPWSNKSGPCPGVPQRLLLQPTIRSSGAANEDDRGARRISPADARRQDVAGVLARGQHVAGRAAAGVEGVGSAR